VDRWYELEGEAVAEDWAELVEDPSLGWGTWAWYEALVPIAVDAAYYIMECESNHEPPSTLYLIARIIVGVEAQARDLIRCHNYPGFSPECGRHQLDLNLDLDDGFGSGEPLA
jgi:hypothetical protein